MKHHSQRSKRPPSRTLAPRILAALAAGAFTLGGMPHGFAAPPDVMSTVTTDTLANDGVAGSTDGTAATITVGTEGGGASPEIYYLAGSDHRPTLVAGAWRNVSLTDGTMQSSVFVCPISVGVQVFVTVVSPICPYTKRRTVAQR